MLCIMYGAVQKVSKSLLRRYTLPKFQTKVVRNIFNYLNKSTFLKDLLRNGLQFL